MSEPLLRLDEELLVTGFGWREAASIINEALNPEYVIAGRVQLAMDLRKEEDKEGTP